MKGWKTLAAVGVLGLALAGSDGKAQLLVWDVSGDNSPVELTADVLIDANLSLAPANNKLTRVGVIQNTGANSYNSRNWNITNTFDENDKYITFQLQPVSGFQMTLTSLQYAINGSNTGPGTGRWGYRVGSGPFTLQTPFNIPFTLGPTLATWDFPDFTTDQLVEFRFWAYGSTSINGGTSGVNGTVRIGNIAGNDLILNGSTEIIPEPSTAVLLVLGLLGAYQFSRRRFAQ
ncbi:MAG: PEP-CTERM sorting domain-containing protein [Verrucomicrobiae bacterium]|nr:PEP-CTERM sorting domain-containing protein [Verrucomicrobiae bacterium]MDW8343093.1 PEP-CTERM sorting domain-containing protein [Verrucomicrobiae bacterium]